MGTKRGKPPQSANRSRGASVPKAPGSHGALHRMCTLAVHWGWLDTVPGFPDRLRENPVWCNKAAEASLVAGRSAAHGPCREPPPVAGVRRPACRPALASVDEDPVGWRRRLAPDRRVVGCVRRCRNLVSIPRRSAASAVQPDVGHHHRRARPVPATGATRGGVGGFVRRCGGSVAAAAGSRAVGRRWTWR